MKRDQIDAVHEDDLFDAIRALKTSDETRNFL